LNFSSNFALFFQFESLFRIIMTLFLALATTVSLFQGTSAANTAACLLDNEYYKTAKSIRIDIANINETPEDSVWRLHGPDVAGEYLRKEEDGDSGEVYFTKPVTNTDSEWYKAGFAVRIRVLGDYPEENVRGPQFATLHISVHPVRQNEEITGNGCLDWVIRKKYLRKLDQTDIDTKVVMDASEAYGSGPKMLCATKNNCYAKTRTYKTPTVQFKLTFNFREESSEQQPKTETDDEPQSKNTTGSSKQDKKAKKGVPSPQSDSETPSEWKRWVPLIPPVVMGMVGIGLIWYSMSLPTAKAPKKHRKKRRKDEKGRKKRRKVEQRHWDSGCESEGDVENPRQSRWADNPEEES